MTSASMRFFMLPGFLGMPSDWKAVFHGRQDIQQVPCDFYDENYAKPQEGFWAWAETFNRDIENNFGHPSVKKKNILLGYSLGGRLAMHALISKAPLWSAAVIVSAHPGLDWEREREQKGQSDSVWAKRFLNDPWEQVITAWNAQPVFKHDRHAFSRNEKDYDRSLLASTLTHWSLSKQQNLRLAIQKIHIPILWVAGGNDLNFSSVASKMRLEHTHSRIWIAPETGHRVPWHNIRTFNDQITQFFHMQ